jgi:hypothetical protein
MGALVKPERWLSSAFLPPVQGGGIQRVRAACGKNERAQATCRLTRPSCVPGLGAMVGIGLGPTNGLSYLSYPSYETITSSCPDRCLPSPLRVKLLSMRFHLLFRFRQAVAVF